MTTRKASNIASRNKSLGREGQKIVKDKFLALFPDLEPDDIYSRPMGSPGEDLMLSPKARKLIPFDIEVKYSLRPSPLAAVEQAAAEGRSGYPPLAILGKRVLRKETQWYACLHLDDFLRLLGRKNNG